MNAYIIDGLVTEYDTQHQLLDSGNVEKTGNMDSMIATRCERLHVEMSAAESKA